MDAGSRHIPDPPESDRSMANSAACSPKAMVALVLGLVAAAVGIFAVNKYGLAWVLSCLVFFRTKSVLACATYVLMYIVAEMSCVPLTPFEILTGFIFGVPFGILLDIMGRITGAVLSFLIARALLYGGDNVQSCCASVKGAAVLRGVGKAVEEKGLRFLILFNLAYVPVAIKNYGLGFVPEVQLHLFVLAILIIEIPMASIWAFIGSTAAESVEAAGLSVSNATVVKSAIDGHSDDHFRVIKLVLLAFGICSVILILSVLHKTVSAELNLVENDAVRDPTMEGCTDNNPGHAKYTLIGPT